MSILVDDQAIQIFKKLTESFGPSGFERETSRIIKEYVTPYSDEIETDKLGSVIALARGSAQNPRILLAGHMDEVGFIISSIDENSGFLTFHTLGGWWDQVLLTQRVVIRTRRGDVLGVIAAKPPHLLSEEEKKKPVSKENMYIDIGAISKDEAEEMGIRIGDPVIPWSPFLAIKGGKVAMGKGFDDRIGVMIILETLRRIKEERIEHPNTVYGAATVQEEVGLRGARTVSHIVDPDVGIIIEAALSGDMPGIKPQEASSKMGKGPTITTFDASMIPNQFLKEFVISTAEEAQIPYQLSSVAKGGNDAGFIHLNRTGCPSIVLGIPVRHIHSHVGLLSFDDVEKAIQLNLNLIKKLDQKEVQNFTNF